MYILLHNAKAFRVIAPNGMLAKAAARRLALLYKRNTIRFKKNFDAQNEAAA